MFLTVALFAGIFSVWAVVLQFQLRHAGLTALALFAPFPFSCVVCLPWAHAETYTEFSCVFGAVAAQITGATSICEGLAPRIASLFAMPLIFPALANAIYTLLPRYRTVDEVFGRR